MVRAKSLIVFRSLAIIVSAAYGETAAKKKSKKKLVHKTAAAKTKATATKATASKASVRHTSLKTTVKTPVAPRRTLVSSRTRRPSVAWKEFVDRASKGNSAEGDDLNGEDLTVREAALSALGPLNGSVLVADPKSGRILSVVNQRLAFSGGEQPCSTIKLSVGLAALSEGLINRDTQVKLNRRFSLNLTEAIAHSNNQFFETLGSEMGFEKVSQYAAEFGFGELAGYHIQEEQLGTFPQAPPSFGGVARMSSFGQDVQVTPLQLAAFVSAIANGGTLYYLQRPKTPEDVENFQPLVKRHLNVQPLLGDLREGMMAAVDHGTARRAQSGFDTVYGKTGTCSHNGSHLGWFASFSGNQDPRLSVVVLLRGGHYAGGAHAAEVAGKVYKNLYEHNYGVSAENRQPAASRATEAAPAQAEHLTTVVPQH
jgi:cell division protein FtsI/penicillin-binding protein 2